jgi:hypothetical protein
VLTSKGVITPLQRDIMRSFAELPDSEFFYLTGGTALADFYLAHRKSYDLDIFTTQENLVLPFSRLFERRLGKSFPLKVIRRHESFVEFQVGGEKEGTRVELAYDSPHRLGEPEDSDLGIKVNDYRDLVVDKLLAFYGRAEPRDAVDLFFILKSEDIWDIAKAAGEKDPGFDLYWLAVAMGKARDYPDEISRWPVEMIEEVDAVELKELFRRLSSELLDRVHALEDKG